MREYTKQYVMLSIESLLYIVYIESIIVTAATNTHATIEELLDASFSKRSVSYQTRVCGSACVSCRC
jgi:hypothetical protein